MFKKIKPLFQKFWVEGNLTDIVGRYSKSSYRYNFTAPEFHFLCQETYSRSVDLQEAIDQFSRGCYGLPLCQSSMTDKTIDISPDIQKFLHMPSSEQQSWPDFIKSCLINYFIGGEIFLLKDPKSKKVTLVNPNEVTDIKIMDGYPFRYKISRSFFERTRLMNFEVKEQSFESVYKNGLWTNQVAHFYNRNPIFFQRGLSIVVSLLNHIQILFKGRTWNRAMLDNEGRPSGVFFYPPTTTAGRRPHNVIKGGAKIEEEVRNFYSGDLNAGKALFLKGGMQFKEVTYKMKDMDFLNGLYFSRESIANRLGIPLQMFGSEKKSTYNNMREARYSFYLNTCIPFFDNFLRFFTLHIINDLLSQDSDKFLCVNKKKIYHASPMFMQTIKELEAQHVLTPNEKRDLLGFERIEEDNMDNPLMPSNLVPVQDIGLVEDNTEGFGQDDEEIDDEEDD